MGRAVKALIALLVAGMVALSGCSGQNPSHAATVDGVVITVAEVEALAATLKPHLQTPPTQAWVTGLLVLSRIGVTVADQAGLTFTDAEREAAAAQVLPAQIAADPAAAAFAADFVTTAMVNQALGERASRRRPRPSRST